MAVLVNGPDSYTLLGTLPTFPLDSASHLSSLGCPSTPSYIHRTVRFHVIAIRCEILKGGPNSADVLPKAQRLARSSSAR
jgi:hypothetical protein